MAKTLTSEMPVTVRNDPTAKERWLSARAQLDGELTHAQAATLEEYATTYSVFAAACADIAVKGNTIDVNGRQLSNPSVPIKHEAQKQLRRLRQDLFGREGAHKDSGKGGGCQDLL